MRLTRRGCCCPCGRRAYKTRSEGSVYDRDERVPSGEQACRDEGIRQVVVKQFSGEAREGDAPLHYPDARKRPDKGERTSRRSPLGAVL